MKESKGKQGTSRYKHIMTSIVILTGVGIVVAGILGILVFDKDSIEITFTQATSLLSLSIASWAGLNIYNAIEKSQVNEITERLYESELLQKKLKETQINEMIYNLRSFDDEPLCLFWAKILDSRRDSLINLDYGQFVNIIAVIDNWQRFILMNEQKEVSDVIDELFNDTTDIFEKIRESTIDKNISDALVFIEGDVNYYYAILSEKEPIEKCKYFLTTLERGKHFSKLYSTFWRGGFIKDPEIFKAYIANSLASTCSEILFLYNKDEKVKKNYKNRIAEIKEIIEKAKYNTMIALSPNDNNIEYTDSKKKDIEKILGLIEQIKQGQGNEMYIKNAGVLFERIADYDSNPPDYNEIICIYEHALANSDKRHYFTTYRVIISILNKKIRNELKVNHEVKDIVEKFGEIYQEDRKRYIKGYIKEDVKKDVKEDVKKMRYYLEALHEQHDSVISAAYYYDLSIMNLYYMACCGLVLKDHAKQEIDRNFNIVKIIRPEK